MEDGAVAGAGGPLQRRWMRQSRRRGRRNNVRWREHERGGARDEDEDEGTAGSRATMRLYRGGPFSTDPWLAPVLKGL